MLKYWPGKYDVVSNPGGVDVVSMDIYQANVSYWYNHGNPATWEQVQSDTSLTTIDLDWVTAFATREGLKVALSEYGAGAPESKGANSGHGLDDGVFTAGAIAWINSLPPALFLWSSWSDNDPADDIVTPGANPAEQQAWITAWRNTQFTGAWWNTSTP